MWFFLHFYLKILQLKNLNSNQFIFESNPAKPAYNRKHTYGKTLQRQQDNINNTPTIYYVHLKNIVYQYWLLETP